MVYLNLSYDYVASFIMFMLLIWYFTEKKVPLKSYRYFAIVLITAFFASVLEVATFTLVRYPDHIPYNVVYTLLSWQMLFIHAFVISLTFCLFSMTQIKVKKHPVLNGVFIVTGILDVLICVLNPGLHWAAELVNGKYRAIGVGYILYIIDAVMVVLMGWIMIARRKEFKFLKQSLVIFLMLCAVLAAIVQLFGYAPMLNLVITVFCLVMYLYHQSPDAVTDKVTDQFTRAFLGEYMQDRFAENKNFSMVIVDLDDFRFINQNYGITVGDELLFQVGKYLEGLKPKHKVFHLDADRFGVVVEREKVSPEKVAKEIWDRFLQPWYQDATEVNISATVCIVNCPEDADSAEELVEVVDYIIDTAKEIKKGKIVRTSEMEMEKLQMTKGVEKAVKDAIASQSIMVYYQPIFSVEKKSYCSAEALVRLHDEQLGWISPDVFIPIAEKAGCIIALGDIILHKVCRFISESNLAESSIEYIDVNVSALQLMQKGFAKKMLGIMEQYGVQSSQVNVEITETAMMTSFSVVNENLRVFEQNQIAISLDDYGSGYSTVNYIKNLPFRYIKVDKEIVQASVSEKKAGIMLKHIIDMLNALELLIVAEGVETEEMREKLIGFGCHYLQGWYYSKALPQEEFLQLIQKAAK